MSEIPTFESDRLIIKPTGLDDAGMYLKIMNTPNWLKYIGDRQVNNLEDAENYIATKVRPQFDKMGYGSYTLLLKSTGEKIGMCGVYDRPGREHPDLGYAIDERHEGKGYATESSARVIRYAFSELGLNRLQAFTTTDHVASIRVLEKNGFSFLSNFFLEGDPEELALFELLNK